MAETRIGILGVGGFGLFCMQQYRQIPGVRITAIGGTNPEKYARLAEEYAVPFYTTDWRTLVTHPEIDILYLATPPDLRSEPAIMAMNAGKHVFCEKPLALSLAEADAMLAAAAHHGVRLGINFVMRYSSIFDQLRAIVGSGALGPAQRLIFENLAGDLPAGHWFWSNQRSGGILIEHGVHFFDIFSSIFPAGQVAWAGKMVRSGGEENRWLTTIRYDEQLFGTFYHAFNHPSMIEHTTANVTFVRGQALLDGWIPTKLTVRGVASLEEAEELARILPSVSAEPLPGGLQEILANGERQTVSHRILAEISADEKQAVYAQAVRDAMTDFIAWTQQTEHCPRVSGLDGRAALAMAVQARELGAGA